MARVGEQSHGKRISEGNKSVERHQTGKNESENHKVKELEAEIKILKTKVDERGNIKSKTRH